MRFMSVFASLFLLAAGWSTPGFAMSINVFDDGAVQYATLQGVIDPDVPAKAKTQLEAALQKKPIAIFIQSDGGAYVAIKPMADLLMDLSKKHYAKYQKPLMVNFQMVCASGCSILSSLLTKYRDPKTLEIRVASATVFGFHGSVIRDSGKTDKKATLEAKDELETQIVQTYLDAGVSSDFIKANANMFKVHFKQTLFPAKQMCSDKTMVIPPDSCVENQLEVYKWIIKWTASVDQQKILIPSAPGKLPAPAPTAAPPAPGNTEDVAPDSPPAAKAQPFVG